MTTAEQAYDAIVALINAGVTVTKRWQNIDGDPLPDEPASFVYTEVMIDPAQLVSFGGGRFRNRYRNFAQVNAYAFVPAGVGLKPALALAEQVATLFRSFRSGDISCFEASAIPIGNGASLKPPGLRSEVGNYYCAICEVVLFFDQIG